MNDTKYYATGMKFRILKWYVRYKKLEILCMKHSAHNLMQRKDDGKDQESIQSSTTPDPGYNMGK